MVLRFEYDGYSILPLIQNCINSCNSADSTHCLESPKMAIKAPIFSVFLLILIGSVQLTPLLNDDSESKPEEPEKKPTETQNYLFDKLGAVFNIKDVSELLKQPANWLKDPTKLFDDS